MRKITDNIQLNPDEMLREIIEPPHVHVESADGEAKYWLAPVALAGSSRPKPRELRELEWFVRLNRKFLLEAWYDFFGR